MSLITRRVDCCRDLGGRRSPGRSTIFELGDHRHNSSPLGEELFGGLRAHPLFDEITHQDESSINRCFDKVSENPSGRKLDQSRVNTTLSEESAAELDGRRGPGCS